MLIRVRGGSAGIREYLEHGRKGGREQSRSELDARVILAGDLELTDTIIKGMSKTGERYLHITLAFKEDSVPSEILHAVTDEFRQFAMTAYEPDEFNFYAEAHLPRTKSLFDARTGQAIERKPHIHIVIPEQNLLTGRNLNPFGRVDRQAPYLEAIQEHLNAKFGLASPKDNRRVQFTDESTIVSRTKGDLFSGSGRDIKQKLLGAVLDRRIADYGSFRALVAEIGDVRVRNAGGANEYLNVKPEGAAKGVNLKDYVFSREFVELAPDQKRTRLAADLGQTYLQPEQPRPAASEFADRLEHWQRHRALELKYINSGNRELYAHYRGASPDQQRSILEQRATDFYAQHRLGANLERQPIAREERRSNAISGENLQPASSSQIEHAGAQPVNSMRDDGPVDNLVSQLLRDQSERRLRTSAADRSEFAVIRRELDARRLLDRVSRTHGVIAEKYEVTKASDGSDRIRVGNRHLNVSDFLTQELHLPFREAAPILKEALAAQRNASPEIPGIHPDQGLWAEYRRHWLPRLKDSDRSAWARQRRHERVRFESARTEYQARRRTIQNDRFRLASQRRGELSVLRMEKVARDAQLRKLIQAERAALRAGGRVSPNDQYRAYLADQAQRGNAIALLELRRQRGHEIPDDRAPSLAPAKQIQPRTGDGLPKQPGAFLVSSNGDVTYFDAAGKAMIRDTGSDVRMLQLDRDAIETGIRFSVQKYGHVLRVSGDEAFRRRVVEIAAATGMEVKFADRAMNESLALANRRRQAGQEFVSRNGPARGQSPLPGDSARPTERPNQQPPDLPPVPGYRSWDLNR